MMKAAAFFSVAVLAGASVVQARANNSAMPESVFATRVALGECVFNSFEIRKQSLDLATGASQILKKGVSVIASVLAEQAKANTWQSAAYGNFEHSDVLPKCIRVTRGRFKLDNSGGDFSWESTIRESDQRMLRNEGLSYADAPDFFFEGRFNMSADKTGVTVIPNYIFFNKPAGTKFLRPGKQRGIALAFSFEKAGDSPSLKENAASILSLGVLSPGQKYTYPVNASVNALAAPWFAMPKDALAQAYTITVIETETEGKSEFLSFLASILSSAGGGAANSKSGAQ